MVALRTTVIIFIINDSPSMSSLPFSSSELLRLLLLQRSTAMQVRSSVRLMPQNQSSGRGLLPSPTAWSPDQHLAAKLADVSRHITGRTEGRGLESGQLVRTHRGKCLKCQSSSDLSALCEDLLRQWIVLPHRDRSWSLNVLSHPVTEHWQQAIKSQHRPYNVRRLPG